MDSFSGGAPPKVGLGLGFTKGQSLKLNINSEAKAESADARAEAERGDHISIGGTDFSDSEAAGKYPTLNRVKNALDVAEDAANTIADLRSQQYDLIVEASETATTERTDALATEFTTIQTEIERVANSATYNGQNVFNSNVLYSTDVESINLRDSIGSPGGSSIVSTGITVYATQAQALSREDTVEQSLLATRNLADGISAASNKADALYENNPVQKEFKADKVLDIKTAEELSKEIAYQISSPYHSEEQKLRIIETSALGLKPERVRDLLD